MTKTVYPLDSEPSLKLPFAALIPESLARYRPVILAAMDFFIHRLPPDRRTVLDGRWAALSSTSPPEVRLLELLHVCPTLHKLGQVLARERRLPIELRRQLQSLESMPPWTSPKTIRETLLSELGGNIPDDMRLALQGVAEASVAVVIPFAWRPSRFEQEVEGVFKVLKPEVAEQIEEELTIWRELGSFLDEAHERFDAPGLDYQDTLESLTELLRAEVRLDIEQAHLRTACETYANSPHVRVPRLLPFCTSRVTAMTHLPGRKVTDATDLDASARCGLARAITDALIVTPMLSADQAAPFHADPHAGNLLATKDRRLGILDWSPLIPKKSHREQLAQIFSVPLPRRANCPRIEALSLRPQGPRGVVDTGCRRLLGRWCRASGSFLLTLRSPCQVRFDSI
jgi:ubiquinone biosynthesis protein